MQQTSIEQTAPQDQLEITLLCHEALFARVLKAALIAPLATLFIGWIVMDKVSWQSIVAWLIVNNSLNLFTVGLTSYYLRLKKTAGRLSQPIEQRLFRMLQALCFLAALSWGATILIFHVDGSSSLSNDLIILCVLIGVVATSVINLSPSFQTIALTTTSGLLPAMLHFSMQGGPQNIEITIAITLLLFSLAQFGWEAYLQFFEGARLLVFNQGMTKQLALRNHELDVLNQQLAAIAISDQLTGLHNRHHIVKLLEQMHEQFVRYGNLCSIALIDIHFFKQVNDQYGHKAGDDVLIAFSACVEGQLRSGESLGRYGGEEFMLVLPMADMQAALQLAQRIRKLVASAPLIEHPVPISISASFGVAQIQPGETIEQWIHRANQALYKAKEHGRNCVMS